MIKDIIIAYISDKILPRSNISLLIQNTVFSDGVFFCFNFKLFNTSIRKPCRRRILLLTLLNLFLGQYLNRISLESS